MIRFDCPTCGYSCQVPRLPVNCRCGTSTNGHARNATGDIPRASIDRMAVIVPLFNPSGYEVFYQNLHRCVEGLMRQGATVFVAEAVYPWQQRRVPYASHVFYPPSPMFHKESLIQAVINTLHPQYDAVAWIDADLIFANDNWVQETIEQLRTKAAVQPFSRAYWLNAEGDVVKRKRWSAHKAWCKTNHPGFAWAARRDILDKHGIYTHGIAGHGDSLWTCAVYGWLDRQNTYLNHLNGPQLSTYWQWARGVWDDVRGHVGCVQGLVEHLPHGNSKGRQYSTKFQRLNELKYDPSKHVYIGESGLLEWTNETPKELQDFLVEFFAERRDDVLS